MDKLPKVILLAVLTIVAVGALFLILSRGKVQNGSPSPALPPAKASVSSETVVGSPDGKFTLTMKEEKGKDNVSYTFRVSSSADGTQKEILTKAEPVGTTLKIPQNTFSPDDKYVFLKEISSGETKYLVLSASGASLTKDGQTLEFSVPFAAKYPDYKITDATGWGGVSLIVFNTAKKDGSRGPSFWFEVTSHSFIQLSSLFN